PDGTEGNGIYDMGEPFNDEYPNGIWDLFEPITFDLFYGQELWNESHRAFATPPAKMHLSQKYNSENFNILVEESLWNGFCIETDTGVHPYDIYPEVSSPEECEALPHNSNHDPVWAQLYEEDVQLIADFFSANKATLENTYGDLQDINGDGKITIVLYDIVDEYIRGSNDTNGGLYTHGYSTVYPEPDANPNEEVTVNVGELLFLDAFPQVTISHDDDDDEDFITMYNAIVHEYTKLLITQNESDEEVWLKEGLAYFEQKRLLGDVKFFGNNTVPGTPAANQLTYISFSKNSRIDHYNVYLFLNYLFEKFSGETGWEIINALTTKEFQGIESVNESLIAVGYSDIDMQDVFIDYATACFMDIDHQNGIYDGMYRMDNVNLYGAPSGKNAASLTFDEAKPPPYSKTGITPWSFDYFLIGGFSVSMLDNSLIYQSPLLDPYDDLIIDGYDGIDFRVNKIMLKNGFTENMNPLYEVKSFDIDLVDGKGLLPVSTNSIADEDFTFKSGSGACEDNVSLTAEECCTSNAGSWNGTTCADGLAVWTWAGNMNMILVVAKVDDTQPPASYDYVISNITSPQDFSDFYVLQNVGVQNFLDLYVVSQRPIFDVFGVEGPQIQIASQYDTTVVLLEPMETPGNDQVIYYSPWVLGIWDQYTLTYEGMDQSGNPVEMDEAEVFTEYSTGSLGRSIVSNGDQAGITIYDTDLDNSGFIQITNNRLLKNSNFDFDFVGLTPVSDVFYFGPDSYSPEKAVKLWFNIDPQIEQEIKVYHLAESGWINLGGSISNGKIQVYSETMGYYLLVSGDNHLVSQELTTIPELFSLKQNYPNPFNPSTKLDFSLPEDEFVTIQIYNLTGQLIRTITQDFYTAGDY
ncbi:MAG: T9SS type A sorting domain-containing protein, partial [Bacteroidetes bacterium]|nr:T9SS type A sorting domain-containing protein [Bacteroidota bacterium]